MGSVKTDQFEENVAPKILIKIDNVRIVGDCDKKKDFFLQRTHKTDANRYLLNLFPDATINFLKIASANWNELAFGCFQNFFPCFTFNASYMLF